ncbi:hypothetical protein COLO4_10826 [Corchorus olitorius]|uniref:Uncharacterized protein n=1 Tax=Corchorus olitorius TaxID=93759 RepID=A0A1R3K6Q4_9ROSI|nr:hypothetical protein COLO4_10826 [Corchorus olitorius]
MEDDHGVGRLSRGQRKAAKAAKKEAKKPSK